MISVEHDEHFQTNIAALDSVYTVTLSTRLKTLKYICSLVRLSWWGWCDRSGVNPNILSNPFSQSEWLLINTCSKISKISKVWAINQLTPYLQHKFVVHCP